MTIRGLIGLIVLFVIAILVMNAKASDLKVRVVEPKAGEQELAVIPLSFIDNDDGTSTIEVYICGANVTLTGPKKKLLEPNLELKNLVDDLINRYCGPLEKALGH